MNARQQRYRLAHKVRMELGLDEFTSFRNSITASAEQNVGTKELQQLKFQVEQYENVLPVYVSRLKDNEEQNKRLLEEKIDLNKDIEQMRERLNKAEAVIFSLGTPESIKQRAPFTEQPARTGATKDKGTPEVAMVDLSNSPPSPAGLTAVEETGMSFSKWSKIHSNYEHS